MSGKVFVTLLGFRLLRYVLTMVVCMYFLYVLICALFMVLGFLLITPVVVYPLP